MTDKLITLIIDAKNIGSGEVKALQKDLQGVGMTSKESGQAVAGMSTGMKLGLLGVAAAAAPIAMFVGDGIKKASDLRETMALTDQVFTDSAQSVKDWAAASSLSFGETQNEALNAAASFGTLFASAGSASDKAAAMSEALAKRAADVGSAYNKSAKDVSDAMVSALTGQVRPMREYGVFLSEAAVGEKALAMGMVPVQGAFSDGQKVLARYQLILDQTRTSAGMFGRDAGSMADKTKLLSAKMDELQTRVGGGVVPVVEVLADDVIHLSNVMDGSNRSVDDWMHSLDGAVNLLQHVNPMTAGYATTMDQLKAKQDEAAASALAEQDAIAKVGIQMAASGAQRDEWSSITRAAAQAGGTDAGTSYVKAFQMHASIAADARQSVLDAADAVRSNRSAYISAWRQTLDERNQVANDKDQIIVNNAEIAAQKKILADSKATAADKANARIRIRQLREDNAVMAAEMKRIADDAVAWGKRLVDNYAVGMRMGKHEVVTAAGEVATVVASHFRIRSPAKEGPLSEGGGPEGYGAAFAVKYAKGMQQAAGAVASASASLAGSAIPGGSAARSGSAGGAGGAVAAVAGGVHLHVSTVYPPSRSQVAEMADQLDAEFRRRYPRFSPYASRP